MNIGQSTIERLLYVLLLLIFIGNVAIFVKLSADDNRKFHVLKANQDQIFCVIKAPQALATAPRADQLKFIDNCIKNNQ